PRPAMEQREAGCIVTTPEGAANLLLDIADLGGTVSAAEVTPYHGTPLSLTHQPDDAAASCLFICDSVAGDEFSPASLGALEAAARFTAGAAMSLDVVLPLTGREYAAGTVGQVISAVNPRRVYVVEHPGLADFGWRGHLEWFQEFWRMYRSEPRWLLGPEAMNTLFARFAGVASTGVDRCWPWFHVQTVCNGSGPLLLGSDIYDGSGQAVAVPTSEDGLRIATFAPAVEIEIPNKKVENGNET
ncbi:uncharacterized protein METZ01_LOCUS477450, partial [marine metagenome]